MKRVYKMDWDEFEKRCKKKAKKIKMCRQIKSIYGVPRGGLIMAVRLSHLTELPLTNNPKPFSTVIVDDCIDSGKTREDFYNFKYFEVLIDKQKEKIKQWVIFPWEKKK